MCSIAEESIVKHPATALIQTAAATFIAFCNQNKISPRLSFQHQDILTIHFEIVIQNTSN